MDGRRMDAEGGQVVHRQWRASKLAIVVAVQNMLVAACLLVTLYVYWGVQNHNHNQNPEQAFGDNVHIQFDPISVNTGNQTLSFKSILSMNKISVGDKNEKICINCTGPYILHIHVCVSALDKKETKGILELKVVGNEAPLCNFTLQVSREDCRGLHTIVYLKSTQQASLHLYPHDGFKFNNVTVGLRYLGSQCIAL